MFLHLPPTVCLISAAAIAISDPALCPDSSYDHVLFCLSPQQSWQCYLLWEKNPPDTFSNTLGMSQLSGNLHHLTSVYQVKRPLERAEDEENVLLQLYLKTACQLWRVESGLIIFKIGFTRYFLPSSISIKKSPWFWLRNQPSKQRQLLSVQEKERWLYYLLFERECSYLSYDMQTTDHKLHFKHIWQENSYYSVLQEPVSYLAFSYIFPVFLRISPMRWSFGNLIKCWHYHLEYATVSFAEEASSTPPNQQC